ncbi:threonine transporter [Niastella vici]|uniref:Threonine transporter n=2 Tax=Niastella vici TaxID=1703345 RepID=A0A1V9FPV8_9BACT|nr:threonine transporter [Niastella vici]
MNSQTITFNSPLESGLRLVGLLTKAYPITYDIQRLVILDYFVVHTGDLGGPESLHAALPMRSKELLVRRKLIESGLLLMMSRNLIERIVSPEGISYAAGEMSETFLNALTSPYLQRLLERAQWVVDNFGIMNDELLKSTTRKFFDDWVEEFHTIQQSLGVQ